MAVENFLECECGNQVHLIFREDIDGMEEDFQCKRCYRKYACRLEMDDEGVWHIYADNGNKSITQTDIQYVIRYIKMGNMSMKQARKHNNKGWKKGIYLDEEQLRSCFMGAAFSNAADNLFKEEEHE